MRLDWGRGLVLVACVCCVVGWLKVGVTGDGRLEATFTTSSGTWRLVTRRGSVIVDEWQYLELSWHPDKGAYVHIAKRRLTAVTHSHSNHRSPSDARTMNRSTTVYVGSFDRRPHGAARSPAPRDLHVLLDELSVWFADRDHVKAFGFLEDGK